MNPKHLVVALVLLSVLIIMLFLMSNDIDWRIRFTKESSMSVIGGSTVKAYFDPALYKDVYSQVYCDTAKDWQLFKKDGDKWVQTSMWYRNTGICLPTCENDVPGTLVCEKTCPLSSYGCKKIDNVEVLYPKFEWDRKFYEVRDGSCGGEEGDFIFVEPAEPGEYKIQFTYYEDGECSSKKYMEKTYTF